MVLNFRCLLGILCVSWGLTGCISDDRLKRIDGSRISITVLEEQVGALMQHANVTGLALAVFNENEVVYKKAFGFANTETGDSLTTRHVFYGASFSKAVFGYVVSQLVEDGLIDLDVPLQSYLDVALPDYPVEKAFRRLDALQADDRYTRITPRMCLSHTTGLPNWRWIEDDGKLKYLYEPGERYNYSGEGIMLLQWVVEHVTQKKYEDLAREKVFEPLGMHRSGYLWKSSFEDQFSYGHTSDQNKIPRDIEEEDATAAGSLETTLDDYATFFSHIMQLEARDSATTGRMFSPVVRIRSKKQFGPLSHQDTTANDAIELSYGLGWGVLRSPYGLGAFKEGHDEGFQHYSIMYPEQGIGVILMSNSDNGERIFKELLEVSIADTYTPWEWENYIPYDMEGRSGQ